MQKVLEALQGRLVSGVAQAPVPPTVDALQAPVVRAVHAQHSPSAAGKAAQPAIKREP